MLYPAMGRNPRRGFVDFQWKRIGKRGFVAAYGPISWKAFRRFAGYPLRLLWRRLLEDRVNDGLGGPPNNWRDIRVRAETFSDGYRDVFARFNNDAHEIWIGVKYSEKGRVSESWKWFDTTATFRKIALWYLWRWAWGEWFGLRRKLFYWDLHRRCERRVKQ